jgi:cyclase
MHDHVHVHSRRDFFSRAFGGILAGATIIESAFLRATWARAQAPGAATNLFAIEKVADDVYAALARPQVLTNCNAAIFVNSKDVLVVDAHSKPSAAAALIAQIKKEITTKPVRYLVNTHLSRNRMQETLDSVPRQIDTLQARLSKAASAADREYYQGLIGQLQAYQAEMKSYTLELPTITFDKSHVIQDPKGDLHIEFHGRAHTAGDVVVFSPAKRAVAAGDVIIGFLPNIGDGYPKPWPATISSVGELPFDRIIPGHGPVHRDRARMLQMRNYIQELTGIVEDAKKAGKPLPELQKSITPTSLKTLQADGYGDYVADNLAKFTIYLGQKTPLEDRLTGNIEAIFNNLDRA